MNQRDYRTPDMTLTAYLRWRGHPIRVEADQFTPGRKVFVFPVAAVEDARLFYGERATVEPRAFAKQMSNIRTLMRAW